MRALRTYRLNSGQYTYEKFDFVERAKTSCPEVHKLLTTGEVTVPRDFDFDKHMKRVLTGTDHTGLVIRTHFIGEDGERYEADYICGYNGRHNEDKYKAKNTSFADALLKAKRKVS